LVHRKVALSQFTTEAINETDVLELASKVDYQFDASLSSRTSTPPGIVKIEMNNGTVYSKSVAKSYGQPENPMSMDDAQNKFRDCVSYSVKPISQRSIDNIISQVNNLETLDDIRELTIGLHKT